MSALLVATEIFEIIFGGEGACTISHYDNLNRSKFLMLKNFYGASILGIFQIPRLIFTLNVLHESDSLDLEEGEE